MLDFSANLGHRGIGTDGAPRHWLSLPLFVMDLAGEPSRYKMRFVLRLPIGHIGPDLGRVIGPIQQV